MTTPTGESECWPWRSPTPCSRSPTLTRSNTSRRTSPSSREQGWPPPPGLRLEHAVAAERVNHDDDVVEGALVEARGVVAGCRGPYGARGRPRLEVDRRADVADVAVALVHGGARQVGRPCLVLVGAERDADGPVAHPDGIRDIGVVATPGTRVDAGLIDGAPQGLVPRPAAVPRLHGVDDIGARAAGGERLHALHDDHQPVSSELHDGGHALAVQRSSALVPGHCDDAIRRPGPRDSRASLHRNPLVAWIAALRGERLGVVIDLQVSIRALEEEGRSDEARDGADDGAVIDPVVAVVVAPGDGDAVLATGVLTERAEDDARPWNGSHRHVAELHRGVVRDGAMGRPARAAVGAHPDIDARPRARATNQESIRATGDASDGRATTRHQRSPATRWQRVLASSQ